MKRAALVLAAVLAVPSTAAAQGSNNENWLSSLGSSQGKLSSGLAQQGSSGALSSDLSSAGGVEEALRAWHQRFSFNQGSSDAALTTAFGLLGSSGGSSDPVMGLFRSPVEGFPLAVDESINKVELVSKQGGTEFGDRYERWTVASPAMGREVGVDVILPDDPSKPGPIVYFLEGVDGPDRTHYVSNRIGFDVFKETNATVLFPTQGPASMWTDWERDDPALGRMKWETFITKELDALAQENVSFNGKRGIMGLSMGGSAAMMIANKTNKEQPGFFDAVAGISGCYSTLDAIGHGTALLTVDSRGGDVANMWGAYSPGGKAPDAWTARDVVTDPSGLRGMDIYMHAATGAIGAADRKHYAERDFTDQIVGSLLEAGAHQCTKNLASKLDREGIEYTADYQETGAHDWHEFERQLAPAWAAIRGTLER